MFGGRCPASGFRFCLPKSLKTTVCCLDPLEKVVFLLQILKHSSVCSTPQKYMKMLSCCWGRLPPKPNLWIDTVSEARKIRMRRTAFTTRVMRITRKALRLTTPATFSICAESPCQTYLTESLAGLIGTKMARIPTEPATRRRSHPFMLGIFPY